MLFDISYLHVMLLYLVFPHRVHLWAHTCSPLERMQLTRDLPTVMVTFCGSMPHSTYPGGFLHFKECSTLKIGTVYVNIWKLTR